MDTQKGGRHARITHSSVVAECFTLCRNGGSNDGGTLAFTGFGIGNGDECDVYL